MNQDGYRNDLPQVNSSVSFDKDPSHNDTHHELMKSRKIGQIDQSQQQELGKKSINFASIENLNQGSTQHLVDPPVPISTRNVFVHSAFTRQNNKMLQQNDNEHQNSSIIQFHKVNSIQQPYQRQQTFMRPKTMVEIQKKYQMSSEMHRHKLPEAILDYIVAKAKLNNQKLKSAKFTQTGKALSKLGLSKQLSDKYHTKKCNICQMQQPEKEFQKMSKTCQHTFCHSCLHQYIIYKINAFIAVECPNEECHELLDQQSKSYLELPLDARKKYKKLLQYEMVKEHPNRKMCPQQNCEGYIEINEFIETICSVCKKHYCPKCLLQQHEGDCDSEQLQFFQGTLHYRQCNKCKNIIQKSSGCVHMTCRCGYQFCYLCGTKWNHSHVCVNPELQPIPTEMMQCCCCEVQVCDCEVCCERCCQSFGDVCCYCCENDMCCCCGCECQCECDAENICYCWCNLLWILVKFLILLGFMGIVFPLYIGYFLFMGSLWICITLFLGSTMYTIEYISELQACWFFVAILLYPITMWLGVALAFREIFCESYVRNVLQIGEDIRAAFIQSMSCD